jgi:hypothetical protein
MANLLDANVFIQAKNDYYGFDLAPGFWDWLDQENARGTVFSIERVGAELTGYGDPMASRSVHQACCDRRTRRSDRNRSGNHDR